jgi:cyclopropane-fatty-acyl-phospholipid synthase
MAIADFVERLLGADLPVRFEAYDGSAAGPTTARATVLIKTADALRRIVRAPGELGFARAYVAGDIEVVGDIYAVMDLADRLPAVRLGRREVRALAKIVGPRAMRSLPAPPEEIHLSGRLHSKERDAQAIAHHYDVGNDFYSLVLGPSLTYSCAVFGSEDDTLEQAQENKYELIARKLDLRQGMRFLDVGCGWGGMVMHASACHGVQAVGVTLSREQFALASKRVVEAGLSTSAEIRIQDYRDIDDGPYDAISSIGMFEHVGESRLSEYFQCLWNLLPPGGRLLNHGISRPPRIERRSRRSPFIEHYVFPDSALHEVGRVVSVIQDAGFEVRHVESFREHYARTLRAWVANLEANWQKAVELVGENRARVWRLYMAASVANFEANRTQIHQVLAIKPDRGSSGMPLRPHWEATPLHRD